MLALLLTLAVAPPPRVVPLANAHAHNDYAHKRPLLDALARGFTSVEADVFLGDNGELLVGHERRELRPGRTLEALYLAPLRQRARANNGAVYPGGAAFHLLIDIKTDAKKTYAAVGAALAKYADVFTEVRDGKVTRRAVTAVISGNRPVEMIRAQKLRYAGIDGRPGDLASDDPAHLMPMVSASWGSQFGWRGDGAMPAGQRQKLRDLVAKAHAKGRLVRFWATPEKVSVWRELRAAKVDLINTDRLDELRAFLLEAGR